MINNQNTAPLKRHCMVVHAYYPYAETRVQREAGTLLAHGHEVDVICLRLPEEPACEVVRGVNVYRLPVQRRLRPILGSQLIEYLHFFVLAALKLTRLHRQKRYGVVQVHNLPDFLVFCALVPKLSGARVILDIHDVMPEFFAARTGRPLRSWPVRLVILQEQMACRFADRVITVTEPWRQALIQRGVAADKTSVVMNVADSRLFHGGVCRQIVGQRNDGTFHLINHGTQNQRYGLDILLRAVAQVRSQIPGLRLMLHGYGDFHEDLVRLANELELTDHVQFSNEIVPISELPYLIASADVGVVPYRRDVFTDGILPTKLMEYVALGLPVIAARTPAIEAYFDETMVQFFEPDNPDDLANSILTLYRDAERRENLVKSSARFLQQYSWTAQSAHYVDLLDQ